jgi:CheY-like chemotaxis protein
MPGYGGLEVCQRLKESAETMKIPVLLTVGKMEPFKPDEAKRVHADAHIVKPFDASELLAALTRLEDRIIPADGRGNGKSKKARFWHSEDPAKNFDDSGTEQIAYLAEVKKRHSKSDAVATVAQTEVGSPNAAAENAGIVSITAEVDRTLQSTASAANIPQEGPESTEAATLASVAVEPSSIAGPPPPEFSVEKGQEAEFQAQPAPVLPPELTVADAVSTSVGEAATSETKSRWVAENVALTAEEASLELDREMHTAEAASLPAEPFVADGPVSPAVPESVAAESAPAPESAGEQFPVSSEPAISAFAAAASVGTPAIAETVSASVPEPPVPSEATAAWENWQHIRDSVMSPQTTAALAESVAEIAQTVAPAQTHDSVTQTLSEPQTSLEVDPSPEPGAPSLSEGQGGSVDLSGPSVELSADSSLEGESLSSIVDSVLAELKPRLMEQIAKKLKSEKK